MQSGRPSNGGQQPGALDATLTAGARALSAPDTSSGNGSDSTVSGVAPVPIELLPGETAQAPAPGTLIAGKYEVLGLLGRGGMGTVLAAKNRDLGTPVAIKLLSRELALKPGSAE